MVPSQDCPSEARHATPAGRKGLPARSVKKRKTGGREAARRAQQLALLPFGPAMQMVVVVEKGSLPSSWNEVSANAAV
jgi:hypothetical protein